MSRYDRILNIALMAVPIPVLIMIAGGHLTGHPIPAPSDNLLWATIGLACWESGRRGMDRK